MTTTAPSEIVKSMQKLIHLLSLFVMLKSVFVSLHQRSPEDVANERGHQQIADYLRELGIG